MIIVDDRLAIEALAGRRVDADDADVATTWGFHYRLLRALADEGRVGVLTRSAPSDLRAIAASPPPERLTVLDPRRVTASAAVLAERHGLNLLAAELVAAAVVNQATIVLWANNVGRSWPDVFEAEGLELRIHG